MAADWNYIEEGKRRAGLRQRKSLVGSGRRRTSHFLFGRRGMSEWTDAHTIPQFSAGFQMEEPAQPHPEKGYVEEQLEQWKGSPHRASASAERIRGGGWVPVRFPSKGAARRRPGWQGRLGKVRNAAATRLGADTVPTRALLMPEAWMQNTTNLLISRGGRTRARTVDPLIKSELLTTRLKGFVYDIGRELISIGFSVG